MKTRYTIIILLFSAFLLTACSNDNNTNTAQDTIVIDRIQAGVVGIDEKGNPVDLNDHHGKWLVVNYWASWCEPCYLEFPELSEFHLTYQENDAIVLGINFEPNMPDLAVFADENPIDFPLLDRDPSHALGLPQPIALPATHIIDPDGVLRTTLYGPQTVAELELAIGLLAEDDIS